MRVEIEKPLLLALQRADELHEPDVLEHVGVVPGVEGVAVVHDGGRPST